MSSIGRSQSPSLLVPRKVARKDLQPRDRSMFLKQDKELVESCNSYGIISEEKMYFLKELLANKISEYLV